MDKLKRVIPLRQFQIQSPLFLTFNIHLNHYNAFGSDHYQAAFNALTNHRGANLKNVHFLPNIVNMDQSIESRAQNLAETIERKMKQLKVN